MGNKTVVAEPKELRWKTIKILYRKQSRGLDSNQVPPQYKSQSLSLVAASSVKYDFDPDV